MERILAEVSPFCHINYVDSDKSDMDILIELLSNYSATLSAKDQNILLAIMKIDSLCMEQQSASLLQNISPLVWGEAAREKYSDLKKLGSSLWSRPDDEQVLALLIAKKVWSSIHHLPLHLKYDQVYEVNSSDNLKHFYDPRFLLPLFASVLSPAGQISRRKFAEVNGLSYAFMCLSLRDERLRSVAYTVLFRFRYHLKSLSDEIFPCKTQLLYILNLVRNSIDKKNERIPHIICLFFARVIQIVQHANDPLYNVLNGFLLLKPTVELDQIPELFKLFNSSKHEKYKIERNWILSLIDDGLREPKDYRILQKRFGLKIFMAYFASNVSYPESDALIVSLVGKVCAMRSGCMDMCYNHSLLPWFITAITSPNITTTSRINLCHHLSTTWDWLALTKPNLPSSLKATVLMTLKLALRSVTEECTDKDIIKSLKDHQTSFVS